MIDVGYERDIANWRAHVSVGGNAEPPGGREMESVVVVVGIVIVLIERDAVLFGKRGVLIVLSTLGLAGATKPQVKRAGTGLLEFARFFEAAVTTLLHGRAPEPRELTLQTSLPRQTPDRRQPPESVS